MIGGLIKPNIQQALTLAAVVFTAATIVGAYWQGWSDRGTKEQARVEALIAERRVQAAYIAAQAETLEAVQQERNRLAEELENAAREDNNATRPAFGSDSMRRLNER
jgi:type II secretory pathway pseudopilin PulG